MTGKYAVAVATDVGIVKEVNQDSISVKVAQTSYGEVAFAILCDGMGGLAFGEVASSHVVLAFDKWFKKDCVSIIKKGNIRDDLETSWKEIILKCNNEIVEYGSKQHTNIGTTVTVMLLFDGIYYISNVGDGRVYEMDQNNVINQITKDQTFVAREVMLGRMTPEQALNDPRKNVLLQCVGVNKVVEPEFFCGEIPQNGVYMICSDGFRHEVSSEEIYECCYKNTVVYRNRSKDELQKAMEQQLSYLIELNKSRNERDNITVALVSTI